MEEVYEKRQKYHPKISFRFSRLKWRSPRKPHRQRHGRIPSKENFIALKSKVAITEFSVKSATKLNF